MQIGKFSFGKEGRFLFRSPPNRSDVRNARPRYNTKRKVFSRILSFFSFVPSCNPADTGHDTRDPTYRSCMWKIVDCRRFFFSGEESLPDTHPQKNFYDRQRMMIATTGMMEMAENLRRRRRSGRYHHHHYDSNHPPPPFLSPFQRTSFTKFQLFRRRRSITLRERSN